MTGSLTVVGTGIKLGAHPTIETLDAIRRADVVFHVVADSHTASWLASLNDNTISLREMYAEGKPRLETYAAMTDQIVQAVVDGQQVCAAFYGHPGIFVQASHDSIARVRSFGLSARMLPAVSAEDCLSADLGFDPALDGLQSYEASMFLARKPIFDPSVPLFLWQVGVIGVQDRGSDLPARDGLGELTEYLLTKYASDYRALIYEASIYAICEPVLLEVDLIDLPNADFSPIASLLLAQLPDSAAAMNGNVQVGGR